MLTKFAVTNFRGFSKRIEWDLSKPNNYSFQPEVIKNGIIKNGIIYGPNGIGKSNFGLALFDIVYHLTIKWKKTDYLNNYTYAGKTDLPVSFEYTFMLGDDTIEYFYSKNHAGLLLTETLRINKHQVFKQDKESFEIDETQFKVDETVKNNFIHSVNGASVISFLTASFPMPQDHYIVKLLQFVNSMLWFKCLESREFIGLETNNIELDSYIIQNNLVGDFTNFLEKVSGQEFHFVKPNEGDKILFCDIDGNRLPFISIASTGTKSLQLLYVWMKEMKSSSSSFVFIDEFDAFYHFKLAFEVCKQLFKLDCQVFMSSHNTYLMTNDLLRPDCNFIIGDNKIKPLNECTEKELRFGHNIEKLFRGNAFRV